MQVGKMLIDLGGLGFLLYSFFDHFSIAQIRMLLSKIEVLTSLYTVKYLRTVFVKWMIVCEKLNCEINQ